MIYLMYPLGYLTKPTLRLLFHIQSISHTMQTEKYAIFKVGFYNDIGCNFIENVLTDLINKIKF